MLSFQIAHPGISVVYNFRIAQVTRQPIIEYTKKHPYTLSGLLFNTYQKTYVNNIAENYTGGLATFIYNFAPYYFFRTDLAASNISRTKKNISTFSGIESDDILCTCGRTFVLNKKTNISLSGLLGIPTHPIFTLQEPFFGSGQVGVGMQLDGLRKLTKKIDFLCGARYNYFVPRSAQDALGRDYTFSIGSIGDVLLALQTTFSFAHGIEFGYSGRWGFAPSASPEIPNLAQITGYMRNNAYLVYKYTFLTKKAANRLVAVISYGKDAYPKQYGFKNAITIWGSWGINF